MSSTFDHLIAWGKDKEQRQNRGGRVLPILHLPPILTLKEGKTTIWVLPTKPVCRSIHHVRVPQGKKHPVVCPGEGCLFCARSVVHEEYAYNYVLDRSDGKIKVLPITKKLVEALKDLVKRTDDPDLSNYDIVMTRTGKTFNTRYKADRGENTETVQVDMSKLPDLEKELRPMSVAEQREYFQEGLQAQEAGGGYNKPIRDPNEMLQENKVQQTPALVSGVVPVLVDEDSVS